MITQSLVEGVARVWLNRPERRHALSQPLLDQLDGVLHELGRRPDVRAIVIGSEGSVFCSGHDLAEIRAADAAQLQTLFDTCARVMLRLRQLPQPVIARVQGLATAAGCQLVAACDLAIAAEEARFATPGVKIGLFCTTPMVPLVRRIPPKKALEMLLTGQAITAAEALQAGLINRVVPFAQLDEAINELTAALLACSSATLALGKRAFYQQMPLDELTAYQQAVEVMVSNAQQADAREGIAAFLEKRPPCWSGPIGP